VYAIGTEDQRLVKIGHSRRIALRLKTLRNACPIPLVLLWQAPGDASVEAALHSRFADRRVRGEWFEFPDGGAVVGIDRAYQVRFAPAFKAGQQVEIIKPGWTGPRYGVILGCGVRADDTAVFHVGPEFDGMAYLLEENSLLEIDQAGPATLAVAGSES
jgi:hypothetical protein